MKIHTRTVWQMTDDPEVFLLLEDESFDYDGAIGEAKGGGETTTVQQATPWSGVQKYLKDLYGMASDQSEQPLQYYPGRTVAGFDPAQLAGHKKALAFADQLPGMTSPIFGAQEFLMGDVLNPESNPALRSHAEAAIRPVEQALTERILPGITGGSVGAGGLGGSRQGIVQAQALRDFGQTAGDITSNIYSTAYGQGLDAMTRGLALAPQTMSLGMLPSDIYSSVGGARQSMAQRVMDDKKARFDFGEKEPWQRISMLSAALQPGSQFGTTATNQQTDSNPILGALGGGLAGYGLASPIYGGLSGFGGPITMGAMGLGALIGGFI